MLLSKLTWSVLITFIFAVQSAPSVDPDGYIELIAPDNTSLLEQLIEVEGNQMHSNEGDRLTRSLPVGIGGLGGGGFKGGAYGGAFGGGFGGYRNKIVIKSRGFKKFGGGGFGGFGGGGLAAGGLGGLGFLG